MALLRASKHALPLGTDAKTGERLSLLRAWLSTHLHVLGPTGVGKSRLLLHLFQHLSREPHATTILLDPKGSLYRMARDWAILHGLTGRLVLFDLDHPDIVLGYSSLKPNGLSWATHAKAVREGILAARAQSSLDETPQLARFLFLVLAAARLLELTLLEAVALLRPGSAVRQAVLPQLKEKDRFVFESLEYFDSLSPRRQEELAASTLARLEAFIYDPIIRRCLTAQQRSLDLAQVLAQHQILLVNLEQYRPLRPDDVRLLGRLLVNDVLAHVFERPPGARSPCYLILDEVQDFATRDLCVALEKGRELGLCCVLAHQGCYQLMEEDKAGALFAAVMENARTKILFGGSSVKDLEQFLAKEMLLDQFDPWTVKDELTSLELDPIETTRVSVGKTRSRSRGYGLALPESESVGESSSRTSTNSVSRAIARHSSQGTSVAHGVGLTQMRSTSRAHGTARALGSVHGATNALSAGSGTGMTTLPDGSTLLLSSHDASGSALAQTSASSVIDSSSQVEGVSEGQAITHSQVHARHHMQGASEAFQQGHSDALTQGTNRTMSHGRTPSFSEEESESESETIAPFYEYHKRRVVSSRTFLNKEEFLTLGIQRIAAQPRGHFLLKVPDKPAVFVRAVRVEEPHLTQGARAQAYQRIFTQPCYATVETLDAEEAARQERVLAPPSSGKLNNRS